MVSVLRTRVTFEGTVKGLKVDYSSSGTVFVASLAKALKRIVKPSEKDVIDSIMLLGVFSSVEPVSIEYVKGLSSRLEDVEERLSRKKSWSNTCKIYRADSSDGKNSLYFIVDYENTITNSSSFLGEYYYRDVRGLFTFTCARASSLVVGIQLASIVMEDVRKAGYTSIEDGVEVLKVQGLHSLPYTQYLRFIAASIGKGGSIATKKHSGVLLETFHKSLLELYYEELLFANQKVLEKENQAQTARVFEDKKFRPKAIDEASKSTSFLNNGFSYVEFDEETSLNLIGLVENEWSRVYPSLPKVSDSSLELRFRKLGRHKATGLYFPSINNLVVDLRVTSSMLHEYGHYIDYRFGGYCLSFSDSFRVIANVYTRRLLELAGDSSGFNLNLSKLDYYLTPTEIFVRCFEYYFSRKLGIQDVICRNLEEYSSWGQYVPIIENFGLVTEYFEDMFGRVSRLESKGRESRVKELTSWYKPLGFSRGTLKVENKGSYLKASYSGDGCYFRYSTENGLEDSKGMTVKTINSILANIGELGTLLSVVEYSDISFTLSSKGFVLERLS